MHAETYISTRIDTFFYNEFDELVGWCWICIFLEEEEEGSKFGHQRTRSSINNSNLV
jgi:hypothetical protein